MGNSARNRHDQRVQNRITQLCSPVLAGHPESDRPIQDERTVILSRRESPSILARKIFIGRYGAQRMAMTERRSTTSPDVCRNVAKPAFRYAGTASCFERMSGRFL